MAPATRTAAASPSTWRFLYHGMGAGVAMLAPELYGEIFICQ